VHHREPPFKLSYPQQRRFPSTFQLGTGTGGFCTATNFSVGDENRFVRFGNFDRDIALDLAVAVASSTVSPQNSIAVLLGNGAGRVGSAV
jgi:hypothetical protein